MGHDHDEKSILFVGEPEDAIELVCSERVEPEVGYGLRSPIVLEVECGQ